MIEDLNAVVVTGLATKAPVYDSAATFFPPGGGRSPIAEALH